MYIKYLALTVLTFLAFSCGNTNLANKEFLHSEIKVMTFNVRYDNPEDSINAWAYRKDNVAKTIKFYDADIVGTQEVLNNQLEDLKEKLPEYKAIGVGREDGKAKGEYSAVLYKASRFNLQDSGYFWLSETPDMPSKGWDAACERIATWVILKDTVDGEKIFVLNTHLDHVGQIARSEGVKLILDKIELYRQDFPIIVTGDFNSTPESSVVEKITSQQNSIRLYDTRLNSPLVYGPSWSFHDFGNLPYNQRPLYDYIFVNDQFKIMKYGVLSESDGEHYLSDHCPVLVTLRVIN